MFLEGTVGVCACGLVVHVEDVIYVAATDGGAYYALPHGCAVLVSGETHRAAARWLRAKANGELAEPTQEELDLIDFELELEHVGSVADLEPLWAK